MIPASHLLVGFVVGRFARQVADEPGAPRPKPWEDPLVAAAIAASVFPDWDVVPGLLGGYPAVHFHRGASHSPVGVVAQALVMAPAGVALWEWLRNRLPRLGLRPAVSVRAVFWVLLAGMGLHALTDALNPWGVAPWWPAKRVGASWNLIHEGDRIFLALAACCAAVALFGRARTILLASVLVFGGFLAWRTDQRAEAKRIAARELGAAAAVYPSPALDCPWTAMGRQGDVLRAACIRPGEREELRVAREVRSANSPLVEASKADPVVADFLEKRAFPFAEIERDDEGGTVVLWRDLRELLLEGPDDPRFGVAVSLDAAGRIVSVEHRWLLKMSF